MFENVEMAMDKLARLHGVDCCPRPRDGGVLQLCKDCVNQFEEPTVELGDGLVRPGGEWLCRSSLEHDFLKTGKARNTPCRTLRTGPTCLLFIADPKEVANG